MAKQYDKIFIRFIKEQNKYNEFVTWNQNYFKLYAAKPKQHYITNQDIWETFNNPNGYNREINEYTKYITNKIIGKDKNFELFEQFILDNYSKTILENYKINLNQNFIETQIKKYENSLYNNFIIDKQNIINTVKNLTYSGYLFYTFEWETSPQGHNYWQNIHMHWKQYMNEYVNKISKK